MLKRKVKNYLYSFMFLLLAQTPLSAKLQTVDSFKQITPILNQIDSDTLVVFDIDEVILTDSDMILRPIGDPLKRRLFAEKYSFANAQGAKEDVIKKMSLPLILAPKILVEKSIPDVICDLQKRNIKVIALTSCPVKPMGAVDDFEKWRLDHLKQFKVSFQKAFPKVTRFVLKNLKNHEGENPVFNQGVLFANGFSKAEVLVDFLNEKNYRPKKIVFIDDMQRNVASMQIKLKEEGISYIGFCYNKVEKESVGRLDERLARYQFDYLFKHHIWLSDSEAQEKMSQEKAHLK